jgi:hypothetical protein
MEKEAIRIITIWLWHVLKKSMYLKLFDDTDKVR